MSLLKTLFGKEEKNNDCCAIEIIEVKDEVAPTAQAETKAESCCAPSGLSQREEILVTLAAALALDNGDLVKQAIVAGKQVGLGNTEIGLISETVAKLQGDASIKLEQLASQEEQGGCCR